MSQPPALSRFCDHRAVARSYYRRAHPGFLRRHVRWYLRCSDCGATIGKGPEPLRPYLPRRSLIQRRRDRQRSREWDRQRRDDLCSLAADLEASGKSRDQYLDELEELW